MGYIVLVVTAFAIVHYSLSELRQEGATMDWNPKYLSEGHALTRRAGRGKSYRTNITVITLYPSSNNITIDINISTLPNQNLLHWQYKFCDFLKQKWASEFIGTYSNIPIKCPVPAGAYGFYNLVLPPKNFPIPFPNSDLRIIVAVLFNPTNEVVANVSAILRH